MIQRADDGFFHPANEQELIELIQYSRNKGYTLRVKGSGHSVPHAIYNDGFPYRQAEYFAPSDVANHYRKNFQPVPVPDNIVPVLLDKFNSVTFETVDNVVYARAGAGVHLGRDPYDPTETSTYFNSLFYQMDKKGVCVPDMGGITHQTVGGFLATGSAGGSTVHSLEPWIHEFRFVDGTGAVHTCSRTNNPDLFKAVGVSMGLLGVVTEVVFKTTKRFDIKGTEQIRPIADYKGYIDFFGNGDGKNEMSLYEFFHSPEAEYSRMLWWPQKGVEKMTVWTAQTMKPEDYNDRNSRIGENGERVLIPKPYQEVNWVFGSALLMENLGDIFYTAVAYWPTWLWAHVKNSWLAMFLQQLVETLWYGHILKFLLGIFVPTDSKKNGEWQPQKFHDTWWRGLPMDNQMDDRLMGVVFTEIWVPIEKMGDAMQALKELYENKGLHATGTFSCEIYCTKASEFWLSPAYGGDVFRIDLFLSATDLFSPQIYYQQFWDLLQTFDMRTHWGKWQPGADNTPDQQEYWRTYMRKQYPKWDDFLDKRNELDPDQIFVNEYWRERFGIPRKNDASPLTPLQWDGVEPHHLRKEISHNKVAPNAALLLGQKPVDQPGVGIYLISIVYTFLLAIIPVYLMSSHVTGNCTFGSDAIMWGIIGVVGALVGFGTVWLRLWGPIVMIILTVVGCIIFNIINDLMGHSLWVWGHMFGLSTFITAVICELAVSIFVPITSWLIGSKLFKKYWPAS